MLEPLIHGQDHQLARSAQLAMHQYSRKVRLHRRTGGFIFVENGLHDRRHGLILFQSIAVAVSDDDGGWLGIELLAKGR
jgi:hypothetical protein